MARLTAGSLVVVMPNKYHAFLDGLKALDFDKRQVVMFALDTLAEMPRKELVGRLSVFKLETKEGKIISEEGAAA